MSKESQTIGDILGRREAQQPQSRDQDQETRSASDDAEERRLQELDRQMASESADAAAEWAAYNARMKAMEQSAGGVRPMTLQERIETDKRVRESVSEYWRRDRAELNRATTPEGKLEWFRGMMDRYKPYKPQVKLMNPEHREYALQYLQEAYRIRVEADGHAYVPDSSTGARLQVAARWMIQSSYNGLLIRGYTGVGKSTLMRSIADVFAIVEGKTTMEVSAMEVAKAGRDDPRRFKEMCDADMLAIDDMGIEPATQKSWGNEVVPMSELITERHRRLRYTVITTNLVDDGNGDQIAERYGERVMDRLKELCGIIQYGGDSESYRGK